MKLKLAIGAFILAAVALYPAFHTSNAVWQSFFAGLSSSLAVLGVGILAINLYLETASRRDAVKALFMLSQEAIAHFHNNWLDLCWARFGRDEFGRIGKEFLDSKQDPNALRKDVRAAIYDIYDGTPKLREQITALESALAELSRMVGWSLDAKILTACLASRVSIAKLATVSLDKSEASQDAVVEQLFHIDFTSQIARKALMQLAGITDSDAD